jgi:two-component system sensor histidine kinase QseC
MKTAGLARPRSVRATLLAGTVAALLVVLGAAGWMSYEGGQEEAQELFDARLATSGRVLEALLARQVETATIVTPVVITLPGPIEASPHDTPNVLGHYYETKIAFQVWSDARALLVRSASAPGTPFAPLETGFSDQTFAEQSWRVFTLRSGAVWIQVAERNDIRSELSEKLALAATGPLIVGVPVLLVLLGLLIRYGLAPLASLAQQIEARRPDALTPIALDRAPAEVAPVLSALNRLLDRVSNALERERRFTADAAHELRTPLAGLKVHAQNAARAASPAERQASLDRMLVGLDRTIHLSEQMLALSRAAAAAGLADTATTVSLRQMVADALDTLKPRVAERRIRVRTRCEPAASGFDVRGNPQQLRSLVSNLVDNALRYGPADSTVTIELRTEAGELTLVVEDEGPGIPEHLRERVFESYYRVPGSPGSGSGLGLAIVKEIAQAHGARVAIGTGTGGKGTRFVVTFPSAAGHAQL